MATTALQKFEKAGILALQAFKCMSNPNNAGCTEYLLREAKRHLKRADKLVKELTILQMVESEVYSDLYVDHVGQDSLETQLKNYGN